MAASSPRAVFLLHLASGIFLGLALLKFGTPAILDDQVVAPQNATDFWISNWPLHWAYGLLGLIGAGGLWLRRCSCLPWKLLALLGGWFCWQWICSLDSINPYLSRQTLNYFGGLVFLFLLGLLISPSSPADRDALFIGIGVGFVLVLRTGIEQHFGGLEATRKYFFTYILPNLSVYPTEYIAKISSNRIFGTLFYPNGLAGGILLFLPPLLGFAYEKTATCRPLVKWGGLLVLVVPSLACLYWSGSKAGWLILLVQATVALLHLPGRRSWKLTVVGILLLGGLVGFFIRYQAFFAKGATSVSARVIYWQSAWKIGNSNPLTGSGPGTFGPSFAAIKPEGAEMARLTHNDYLQQLSDSGWPGLAMYLTLTVVLITALYRNSRSGGLPFLVWLGLLGWAVQGLAEFGLYIPALGWGAFFFFGWLWGNATSTPGASTAKVSAR